MKKLLLSIATVFLLLISNTSFSQTPNGTLNLGILESFEGFTGAGAVTNGGASWIGDAGTNAGALAGFAAGPPSFIGNTYAANASTAQARFDLFRLYIHLNALYVNYPDTHPAGFGSGETLTPGVYSRSGAMSLLLNLTLDGTTNGVDNPDAFFVIKCAGAFSVGAGANIILKGGTRSCNVFFVADGDISVGAGLVFPDGSKASLKGTFFAKIGAVGLGTGVDLEGRMLSMQGALVSGTDCVVRPPADECTIPIFCETGCNPAPEVDVLGSLSNYALYTASGEVTNTSISGIDGNIGTHAGAVPTAAYASSIVVGEFHAADASTLQAKTDVLAAYDALMLLPATVPNLGADPPVPAHSAGFGAVVTLLSPGETVFPGVYDITGAGTLLTTLILDGGGNTNAIFVFRFTGTLSVGAAAKMILLNGARRCNVFWIAGAGAGLSAAIDIGAGAAIQGTFLAHGGAVGSGASTFLAGRQISTGGAITTYGGIIYNNPKCVTSVTLKIKAITETTDAISGSTGGTTPALTSNDVLGGIPVIVGTAPGNVKMTIIDTPQTGLSVDTATGIVTVAPNTPAGSWPVKYTLCEVSKPTSCSTVTSYITVSAPAMPVIIAENDSYDDLQCNASATLGNVLTNDKLNTISLVASEVTITLESGANANIILNTSTGDLSITDGLQFGEYTLEYKICEKLNPANCSNGTISIKITQKAKPAIVDCSDTFTFINCDWVKDNKLPLIR